MSASKLPDTRITLSQVAELAGVSPSAVSNWRKRLQDFPASVATGPGGRELFDLDQVEGWLVATDRFDPGKHITSVLWKASAAIRDRLAVDELVELLTSAIAFVHLRVGTIAAGTKKNSDSSLTEEVRLLEDKMEQAGLFAPLLRRPVEARRVVEVVSEVSTVDRARLFEEVLEKQSRFVPTRSSPLLTELTTSLVALEPPQTLFDPACGEGGFLLSCARRFKQTTKLYGQERDERAWRIARQRFLVNDVRADIRLADSLSQGPAADLTFDAVVADPPYNLLPTGAHVVSGQPWAFGIPPRKSADLLWPQVAIGRLNPNGRAYIFLPMGAFFRGGQEADIRREMVRQGVIEALILLPEGTAHHTSIPLVLLVLKTPQIANAGAVLMADFSDAKLDGSQLFSERVVNLLRAWRVEGSIPEEESAAARTVSAVDLLVRDANLNPARWVKSVMTTDVAAIALAASTAWQDIAHQQAQLKLLGSWDMDAKTASRPERRWASVRELIDGGIVEVHRGMIIKADEYDSRGTRALRTRDIRSSGISNELPSYVDVGRFKKVWLTEPGDVIVSPGGGKPHAAVDKEGGHVVVSPLQVLRFRSRWLDPEVAAVAISHPRNKAFVTGTAYSRIELEDAELPALSDEEIARARAAAMTLAQVEQGARRLADAVKSIREHLLDIPLEDLPIEMGS